MEYVVYILLSIKDGKTYVGYTSSINSRLLEHNSGKVGATKHRKPFKILFIENVDSLVVAKKRELYWKSGGGRRKLKEYFARGFPPIPIQNGRGSPR